MVRSRDIPTVCQQQFRRALVRAIMEIGGDRAAEKLSGVSKSVWYDAKTGRAVPDGRSTWPAMRETLERVPAARTGVRDWDELYQQVCAEAGRPGPARSEAETHPPRMSHPRVVHPQAGSSRPVPQQLPPGTSGFVGREAELAALDRVLLADPAEPADPGRPVPIAIVVGLPGVGKTALAVTWAHRALGGFPDGVLHVDLRGWGPDQPVAVEEVLPAWLRAVGMDPRNMPDDVASRSAALRSVLADKRTLLVLDNARTEEQVRPLLPGAPSCSVLVTSRRDLPGLAIHHGARVVRLDPFTTEESTGLLRRIVGTEVDRDRAAATAIAVRCGRLPLALRIAAEMAKSRPGTALGSLAVELGDERGALDQLAGDDPRTDPRTVFSWSYRQLPTPLAATFRLLGLLPGGAFDQHVVAALADATPLEAAAALRALARAHLVAEQAGNRFETHDLIRVYTRELVARETSDAEAHAARLRLFHYLLHATRRADELLVPHRYRLPLPAATQVPAPMASYEQALHWLDAECGMIVALCRLDEPSLDSLRWRLAFQVKSYFFLTKRIHEWLESHEAALAAAIRSGERLGEAITRNNLGLALHERGQDEAALAHYQVAERIFIEMADPHGESNSLAHQAVIHRRRGEHEQALELNRRALDFYRQGASTQPNLLRYVAITLRGIGLVELELRRLDDAARHLTESLEICTALRMDMNAARAWNTLGKVWLLAGRHDAALRSYQSAIEASQAAGSRYEEARARRGLGEVFAATGDHAQAEQSRREAQRMLAALGVPPVAQ